MFDLRNLARALGVVGPEAFERMRFVYEANQDMPIEELATFLGQLAYESGGFRHLTEIGNRAYFDTYESHTQLGSNLGNTQPGDGYRFRGRGFIQLTGRDNYTRAGQALGLDLVNNPDLLLELEASNRVARWFWEKRGCPSLARNGNIDGVTRRINGGTSGLDDRKALAKAALKAMKETNVPHATPNTTAAAANARPSPTQAYRIQPGDTLSWISEVSGVPINRILELNPHITDPNNIRAFSDLKLPNNAKIPPTKPRPSVEVAPGQHQVQSGDNLTVLAKKYGCTVTELLAANPDLKDANLIKTGQKLKIPQSSKIAATGAAAGAFGSLVTNALIDGQLPDKETLLLTGGMTAVSAVPGVGMAVSVGVPVYQLHKSISKGDGKGAAVSACSMAGGAAAGWAGGVLGTAAALAVAGTTLGPFGIAIVGGLCGGSAGALGARGGQKAGEAIVDA